MEVSDTTIKTIFLGAAGGTVGWGGVGVCVNE